MTNLFDVLDLPQSLLVEPSSVDSAWDRATRSQHPDVSESERDDAAVSDANQARSVLSDPTSRLEHWLTLRGVEARRDQLISPELMDLFTKLNPVLTDADSVISRLQKASTALAKAMLAKEAANVQLRIQEILGKIMAMKLAVTERFEEFEKAGDYSSASEGLGQLKFLKKWEQQGQAKLIALLGL